MFEMLAFINQHPDPLHNRENSTAGKSTNMLGQMAPWTKITSAITRRVKKFYFLEYYNPK